MVIAGHRRRRARRTALVPAGAETGAETGAERRVLYSTLLYSVLLYPTLLYSTLLFSTLFQQARRLKRQRCRLTCACDPKKRAGVMGWHAGSVECVLINIYHLHITFRCIR